MTIEVVYHTSQGEQKVTFSNIESVTYGLDSKVLEVFDHNDDENSIADFRDWTYWRKVND